MSQTLDRGARVALLTEIGKEVSAELLKKHTSEGGDPKEITFLPEKLVGLVDEYVDHLEHYRAKHIPPGNNVAGDKIGAFTGTLIMRHEPFESKTGQVNTAIAALANEVYAIRVSELFTRCSTFGFKPPDKTQLIHCFGTCYDHDNTMHTWTVATLSQQLDRGNIKEPKFQD